MSNRPPTGLCRRLRFLWRRFRCPHSHVFQFHPELRCWVRHDGTRRRLTDNPRVYCCVACGQTWGENWRAWSDE
jgi:hypothetical protein